MGVVATARGRAARAHPRAMATVAVSSNGVKVAAAEQPGRGGFLLAVAGGLLLAASFPALDLEPLAWVGLVPLLVAARGRRPRAAFALGWTGGLVFYLATVYWVAYTITHYTAVPLPLAIGILVLMASILACYHGAFLGGLRVAIAQGNIEQDHKWDPAYQGETMARYRDLTGAAAASRPELVVWPETATPFFFQEPGPLRDDVLELAERHHVHLLFGSPAARQTRGGELEELNRAYLVSPEGREVATYDKIQLVPFGEYVPFERALFFVDRIVEAIGRVAPGLVPTVFHLPAADFGV